MTPKLVVQTDTFYDAAQTLISDALLPMSLAASHASDVLAGCGAMSGGDPVGAEWGRTYDSAAATTIRAAQTLSNASYHVGLMLERTGVNHERAEAASTPGGAVAPRQSLFDPGLSDRFTLPPSAVGGTGSAPTGWGLVEGAVGYVWPGGHQDRLHTAAGAWTDLAQGCTVMSQRMAVVIVPIEAQSSPEVDDAITVLLGLQQHVDDLAHAARTLAHSCQQLAAHIDTMRSEVEHQLVELAAWTAGIEAAGAVGAFFTGGAAEGAAQYAETLRIAATARTIKAVFETAKAAIETVRAAIPGAEELASGIESALAPLQRLRLVDGEFVEARGLTMEARAGKTAGAARKEVKAESGLAKAARPRKVNASKGESKQWRKFKPYRGSIRTNGLQGKRCRYYTWDHTHNDIEVFDKDYNHLGSMNPKTGRMTKSKVHGRRLDDN